MSVRSPRRRTILSRARPGALPALRLAGRLLAVAAGVGATAFAGEVASSFRPPAPIVRTLANGLTVAVFPDARLPLVQIQILVAAGAAQEPAGEQGLASLTVQLLGQGTASRSAADFATAIEALGGSVAGNAAREFATVSGTFLAGDFEAGLELLADAVVRPVFDEEPLAQVKSQMSAALARARQNPATLADEHLWAAVFRDRPYGRSPLGAAHTLATLGLREVRVFHRDRYRPDGALLAIAGDVTQERAFRAAEELLGPWGGVTREAPTAAPAPPDSGWRVRIVDAPGLARVELRVGAVGPARAAADYDALVLASELMPADWPPGWRVSLSGLRESGLLAIATSAPVDSVGPVMTRLKSALARWVREAPSEGTMRLAQRRLVGGFPLQFETLGGAIAQWMAAAFHGLPFERVVQYPERMAAISEEEARAAAARWVGPERMVLVAAGPAERLREPLAALGPVEVVTAEAAAEVVVAPSAAGSPPSEEERVKGRALVEAALTAHGGLGRLRRITDSTLEGDMHLGAASPLAGRIVQVRKEPQRFRFESEFAVLRTVQVLDGDRGWSQAGGPEGEVEDLDSLAIKGLRAGFRSDLQHLLLTAADPAARVAWRGQERRDERDTDVIEVVAPDGDRRVLFLDTANHRLVAMEQSEGGHLARRIYRDYRSVAGVLWPFSEERLLDGQRSMLLTLRRVALNTGVKDEVFRRPDSLWEPFPGAPRRPR